MTTIESTLQVSPQAADAPARVDESGVELKRGAILNTIAMLASNFRGIFTFLVARLLGPAALGIFSVAWSATDVLSKIGVLGLDNAIITFIARSEALGDRARSRMLFRLAVVLGVSQSVITAVVVIGTGNGFCPGRSRVRAAGRGAVSHQHICVAWHESHAA
jgi:O-antigen/teichoic acid export membrane protein